jgi:hypothetical protein
MDWAIATMEHSKYISSNRGNTSWAGSGLQAAAVPHDPGVRCSTPCVMTERCGRHQPAFGLNHSGTPRPGIAPVLQEAQPPPQEQGDGVCSMQGHSNDEHRHEAGYGAAPDGRLHFFHTRSVLACSLQRTPAG